MTREKLHEIASVAAAAVVSANAAASDANHRRSTLQTDYQVTADTIKLLADIRFKCLTFVTAVIAIASALLAEGGDAGVRIVLAAVGFIATLGITIFDLRNSQLYEVATHRAKHIESELRMLSTKGEETGGLLSATWHSSKV